MAGVKNCLEDEIKFGEDSIDQLSTTACVEQEEIEIKEDPHDLPFCAANLTEEKFNVGNAVPYDQLSFAACAKQEGIKAEEEPRVQLSSAACVKYSDEEER
jgi:hypothetical protein